MKQLFESLAYEEKRVVQAFVWHGSAFVLWSDVNTDVTFSSDGVEGLVHRGLVHYTTSSDGMREGFVLDIKLFDYAQSVVPEFPF